MGGNAENLTLLKIIKHRYQGEKRTMITVPTDLEKEIIRLAHVIAKSQRNEDDLQSQDILLLKLHAEINEIRQETAFSVKWWSEAADIMYYLLQIRSTMMKYNESAANDMFNTLFDGIFFIWILFDLHCDDMQLVLYTMTECCMLKYTARARDGKNKITENAAIEGLLKNLFHVHNTDFIK